MPNDIYVNIINSETTIITGSTDIAYVRNNWNVLNDGYRAFDLSHYLSATTDFEYFATGGTPMLDINDDTKLLTRNAFGNYLRVTNNSGGTDYDGTGGTIANYAIDHFTGIGWYLSHAAASEITWAEASSTIRTLTAATFSDWRMPTMRDVELIELNVGNNENILSSIERWSGSIFWLLNSASASNVMMWRMNQDYSTGTKFDDFSTAANAAIYGIACRNHYTGTTAPIDGVYYNRPEIQPLSSWTAFDEGYWYDNAIDSASGVPDTAIFQEIEYNDTGSGRTDYLKYFNIWNHKFRFTGINGGYYDEADAKYYDSGGTSSDFQTEFSDPVSQTDPHGYAVDHLTGLGWRTSRGGSGGIDWWGAFDVTGVTSFTFSDWLPPPRSYMETLRNHHRASSMYPATRLPFTYDQATVHTTNTNVYSPATFYQVNVQQQFTTTRTKTTVGGTNRVYMRLHYTREDNVPRSQ